MPLHTRLAHARAQGCPPLHHRTQPAWSELPRHRWKTSPNQEHPTDVHERPAPRGPNIHASLELAVTPACDRDGRVLSELSAALELDEEQASAQRLNSRPLRTTPSVSADVRQTPAWAFGRRFEPSVASPRSLSGLTTMATARDTTLLQASVCLIRDNRGPMLVFAVVADVARVAPAVRCALLRLAAARKKVTISGHFSMLNVRFAGSSCW